MFLKRYYIFILIFIGMHLHGFSQDQKLVDSLINIHSERTFDTLFEELEILESITVHTADPNQKIQYANEMIDKASKDSLFGFLLHGYLQKGNGYKDLGNYSDALEAFLKSWNYSVKTKNENLQGRIKISMADTYSESGNSKNAAQYYEEGIAILRKNNDSLSLAKALLNAGDEAFNVGNYGMSIHYFKESGIIFEKVDFILGTAYNLGNMGMVYAETGEHDLAAKNINGAIEILEELEDYYPISVYLTYMSDIYVTKNDMNSALKYAEQSLSLAKKYKLKKQIRDANLKLSELYENRGSYKNSFAYYKDYVLYRDSILNIETVEEMADLRTEYEVSQKQIEVDLLEKDAEILSLKDERNQQVIFGTVIALGLIILLAIGLFQRNKYIKHTKEIIEEEKLKSDTLLLNILPEETAKELKEQGKVAAKRFDSVSILFTDFKGFTHFAENLDPEILVQSVDYYFSRFDAIIERYGLEKIKTVGDAYMCAGGLPFPTENHANKIVEAALEIADEVERIKLDPAHEYNIFDIRIGINTGPVVAGVVGTKKFVYDIWGDAVNIAARMESNSEPGKVNVSENTYKEIKENFDCEFRGEIEAKNKGTMKMYFVNRKK